MKRLLGCFIICVAAITFAAADDPPKDKDKDKAKESMKQAPDTYEALLKQLLKNRQDAGDVLTKITDAKTAAEQKPNLSKLSKEMIDLAERLKKVANPGPEQEKKLRGAVEPEFAVAFKNVHADVLRLQATHFGKDIVKLMRGPAPAPQPAQGQSTAKTAKKGSN